MAAVTDGMGARRPFLPHLLITSSTIAVGSVARGAVRNVVLIGRHAGALARLAVDASSRSPSAPTAQNVLRDELLELWRELAAVSWQESRRAIDELDARTRSTEPAPVERRGHRVKPNMTAESTDVVIADLGASDAIDEVRARIERWLREVDEELRQPLEWMFSGPQKHFRPLTLFACHEAVGGGPIDPDTVELAFAVELVHNMSLIVDDILDESRERRGIATIHARFGRLHALMASGYLVADAYAAVADDAFAVEALSELVRRLGSAECLQWRLRRQPLGVEDWRRIAGEDTGSMFEICAVLGGRSQRLRQYGAYLGMLYHGCDDVGDQRGLVALGGGGDEDIRDGILTLPAALAIRDPAIRALFVVDDDDPARLTRLAVACRAQLDEAEVVLDGIAAAARDEALRFARHPDPLIALVDHVRQLSRR